MSRSNIGTAHSCVRPAGKLLTNNAIKTVVAFPFALGAVYILLFLFGQFTVPIIVSTLLWGTLSGIGGDIIQYWVVSSAPEAPEFSNGLFLTVGNLGITVGAATGGLFISALGIPYFVFVGFLSLLVSLVFILIRTRIYTPQNRSTNLSAKQISG
ncbi:MFS transporter [Cohnella phaseoli]|uniref:MFS transporter n=1 Tax=Cohnella phaseoli TaxID=456490 RepID=A0A3D9KR87_9BACL|nr:hypothetical protein DFP98_101151 [Cohnella phaseoli]